MKRFKNMLIATDTRFDKHPIVEEAAQIAVHNQASLKIVDVVPELPWTVRLSLKDHEHFRELIAREKAEKLEALAAPIRARGIQATTKVLMGRTSVELIREVLREQHDLVMRVAKGRDSRRKGFFGTTGIRLLRKCPCAVWLVTPGTTPEFKHVLGCVNTSSDDEADSELNRKIFELASSISQYQNGRVSIVHAWSLWNEQMLKSRMSPEEFHELEKNNQDQVMQLLDKFLAQHGSSIRAADVHLLRGEAEYVIPKFARDNGVDLVVMGTVARAGLAGIVTGNTAELILSRIECSVLALKPAGFVCPIQLEE